MGLRDQVVAEGMRWVGKLNYSLSVRYDFRDGGSADCSSFFQHCLQVGAGVNPGSTTSEQVTKGWKISRGELLPGDGVFYPGHVVLYIGNNQCLSQGGPNKGPIIRSIDYRSDISQYRRYFEDGSSSAYYTFSPAQVRAGDTGISVLLLQEILTARGYNTGGLDWSFGGLTDTAVRAYQKSQNLSVDGVCGPSTWNSLLALEKTGNSFIARQCTIGDVNTSVLLAQEILKARNIYTGGLDWNFGAQMLAAVKQYQTIRNGASGPVDGIVGPKMWADMIAM